MELDLRALFLYLMNLVPDNLCAAIMSNDYKQLARQTVSVPRQLRRLILELRDKISLEGTIFEGASGDAQSDDSSSREYI